HILGARTPAAVVPEQGEDQFPLLACPVADLLRVQSFLGLVSHDSPPGFNEPAGKPGTPRAVGRSRPGRHHDSRLPLGRGWLSDGCPVLGRAQPAPASQAASQGATAPPTIEPVEVPTTKSKFL